jgi:hypothetical protein
MRTRGLGLAFAGLLVVGCFLPKAEFDPNAGKAAAGAGGGAGAGGSAGAGGGGGDPGDMIEEACSEYCTTYLMACEGQPANTYDDIADCALTCASSGWPLGTFEEPNSISCRLIHAGFALAGPTDPHCFHSAEVPSKGKCD